MMHYSISIGPTFSVVAKLVIVWAHVSVDQGPETILEIVAQPLAVVAPVVELVGCAPLVPLGHAVAQQSACNNSESQIFFNGVN